MYVLVSIKIHFRFNFIRLEACSAFEKGRLAMAGSMAWNAVFAFCKKIMSQKEAEK